MKSLKIVSRVAMFSNKCSFWRPGVSDWHPCDFRRVAVNGPISGGMTPSWGEQVVRIRPRLRRSYAKTFISKVFCRRLAAKRPISRGIDAELG